MKERDTRVSLFVLEAGIIQHKLYGSCVILKNVVNDEFGPVMFVPAFNLSLHEGKPCIIAAEVTLP